MQSHARDTAGLIDGVCAGERHAVAVALNILDVHDTASNAAACALMAGVARVGLASDSHLIGITGPPGVGKSTLISALVRELRDRRQTVAVLAVDPTSEKSGGSLLGDRLRITCARTDDGVFVRSIAARNTLGGLSASVWPISVMMLAAFDRVLVETVGIGQSEIEISKFADTSCYVAQPAAGDSVQFLKAGIIEIPDVVAINKADLGAVATQTAAALEAATKAYTHDAGWSVPTRLVSASEASGIDALLDCFERHRAFLDATDRVSDRRAERSGHWVVRRLTEQFGTDGLNRLGGRRALMEATRNASHSFLDVLTEQRERMSAFFVQPQCTGG